MTHLRYRSDIDGLRAIAVLPVVFFHLGISPFSGGYIGVDVFFVISGFLITSVISKDIEAGDFSIVHFYERRARRILPALFVVVGLTVAIGWLVLLPDEYRKLGSRVVAVSVFSSNVLFWKQADYFAGPTEMETLLHTWSLAVEEQFYLFWPFVVVLAKRLTYPRGGNNLLVVTSTLALLSLLLSIALINVDRTGDYYLITTRAWELLAGAVVASGSLPKLHNQRVSQLFALAGLALIIAPAVLLTRSSVFPGYNALWPVIGAAVLLYANDGHVTLVGRVLGSKPFVAVGLLSYSLYLVHWPMIVFVKYEIIRDIQPLEKLWLLAAMFLLAAGSWRYIERPFRNKHRVSRGRIFALSGTAIVGFSGIGLMLFVSHGFPSRFPGIVAHTVDPTQVETGPPCFLKGVQDEHWGGPNCFLTGRNAAGNTLLWGDSHANQYREVFRKGNPLVVPGLLLYATSACLPVFDVDMPMQPACRANNARIPAIIREFNIKSIIVSANWEYEMQENHVPLSAVAKTIAKLRSAGLVIKLIGDNPFYSFANPGYLAYRLRKRDQPLAPYMITPANNWQINRELETFVPSVSFFDPERSLCDVKKRVCLVYDKGQLVMEDTGHLATYGQEFVASRMASFLAPLRKGAEAASPHSGGASVQQAAQSRR